LCYVAIKIWNILVVILVSFWGASPPPDPHRRSAPGPRWGTSVPRPPLICSPGQIHNYATDDKAWTA